MQENFIPIKNYNDNLLVNPITIYDINYDTFKNGILKLALLTNIIPGNFSGDKNGKFFSYERFDPSIPINVSQKVDVLENVALNAITNVLYSEAITLYNGFFLRIR